MGKCSHKPTIIVSLLLVFVCSINCEQHANPQHADNTIDKTISVMVHFMDLKRQDFIDSLPKVKEAIAKSLGDYCNEKASVCSNYPRTNISSDSVEFLGHAEKEKYHEEGRFVTTYMALKIAELDPYKTNVQSAYLPKENVQEFLEKYRDDIVKESGVQIAYVDNKLVYPQRNNIDNWVIVTVSCVFCLFLIVFNLVCQRKIEKQAREEFLKKASELKPLVRYQADYSAQPNNTVGAIVSNTHEVSATPLSRPHTHSISRHDSFDQKLDELRKSGERLPSTSESSSKNKRRKSRSGSNASGGAAIAGNIGSGIGSPRNMADDGRIRSASSIERDLNRGPPGSGSRRHLNASTNSINRYPVTQDGEVQIPIHRVDSNFERRNYQVETVNVNEYPDPRVAYRLASNNPN